MIFRVHYRFLHTALIRVQDLPTALIGNGSYNFIKDDVNLDMRVNANALFGILLYPISKIFEYHGTGPMKNVKWVPKNF